MEAWLPAASCFLSLGPGRGQKETTGSPGCCLQCPALLMILSLGPAPPFQEEAGLAQEVSRLGGWSPRPQGREGAQQGPGAADSRPSPSILSRAWRQWALRGGEPGRRAHCTQCLGHTMHKGPAGQAARAHSCQYHLEPLPGLRGPVKKLDSVPGHSRALFLSQGGNA